MSRAAAVFGVPCHNGARHVAESIESLLGQTRGDLAVVLLDDASDDETFEVAERYAALDPRVWCLRSSRRLGLVAAWNEVLRIAANRHPDARYFAWASDHDFWHPRWLEVLTGVLDSRPEVVVAFPRNQRLGDDGSIVQQPYSLPPVTGTGPGERFMRAIRLNGAGDIVYGLMRTETALSVAGLERVVLPDRLFLARVALHGELVQVPEVLWYRRFKKSPTPRGQRRTLFGDRVPVRSHLLWWMDHSARIAWGRAGVAGLGRGDLVKLATAYAREGARRSASSRRRLVRHGYHKRRERVMSALPGPLRALLSALGRYAVRRRAQTAKVEK